MKMKLWNLVAIVLYLTAFVADLILLDRINRIVYADSFLITAFFSLMLLILLFVSLKNIKTAVGKIGLGILVLTVLFRYALDLV